MIRLKTILQYNYIYALLLIVVILFSFGFTNLFHLDYNFNDSFEGVLTDKNIDGDKVSMIINDKVKIKAVYYLKDEDEQRYFDELDLGVRLKIDGKKNYVDNNTIPNTFNYKEFLKKKDIKALVTVENYEVINYDTNLFYRIKNLLRRHISTFRSKAYLETFVIGKKEYLDDDTYKSYQNLGVSHIFAISGMHITLLTGILLKFLSRFKDGIRYTIVIIFLLFYMFLTNYTASVSRSVILFIILYLNKRLDTNISTINCYMISIVILLLINPYYLYDMGFIYSSIVSFALIKYSKLFKGNYFISVLKVSLIAFLFSLPITVMNNYEINILSILNNIFFVPVISFVIYPLSLLTLLIRVLDNMLFTLTSWMKIVSNYLFVYNVVVPKMNILTIIIYYLLLFLFMNSYKKKILCLMLFILFIPKFKLLIDNSYYIYYLDVGQGDSSLIINRNKAILIDTGGKISYKKEDWRIGKKYYVSDNVIRFLKSIGIDNIDYFILTHGDYDHIGDANNIVNNFKVNNVIFNFDNFNKLEDELINTLKDKGIKYYKGLEELNIGKRKIYFLNSKEFDNENDNSNVIYFEIYDYKFLFMGDAGVNREKEIVEKYKINNIDFIKIGHHGSNTSSSVGFIDYIKPKNCLISVGKNNRYGHPKESVLDTLDDYCNIYRTDVNGSIEIKINKNNYVVKAFSP